MIGNSSYRYNAVLRNPRNDAKAMETALRKLGFDVISGYDQTQSEMGQTIQEFSRKVAHSEAALFFYAGHSIQKNDLNYLIPIDADLSEDVAISLKTIPLAAVTEVMIADDRAAIALIDACRDNPLAPGLSVADATRSVAEKGLAVLQQGGLLIGYATAPGAVAQDGDGEHSPFTGALLKHIGTPDLEVETMLKRVRGDVRVLTHGEQIPWTNSAMYGEFYFAPTRKSQSNQPNKDGVKDISLPDTANVDFDAAGETIVDILPPTNSEKSVYDRIVAEPGVDRAAFAGRADAGAAAGQFDQSSRTGRSERADRHEQRLLRHAYSGAGRRRPVVGRDGPDAEPLPLPPTPGNDGTQGSMPSPETDTLAAEVQNATRGDAGNRAFGGTRAARAGASGRRSKWRRKPGDG